MVPGRILPWAPLRPAYRAVSPGRSWIYFTRMVREGQGEKGERSKPGGWCIFQGDGWDQLVEKGGDHEGEHCS